MIQSVSYNAPAPSTRVAITMADGQIWSADAGDPGDGEIGRLLVAWIAEGGVIAPYVAPPAPPRFYSGPDIAAAVDRWGATGDAALDALSSREWFALSAGVAADHPALSALLRAAGKTLADLDP